VIFSTHSLKLRKGHLNSKVWITVGEVMGIHSDREVHLSAGPNVRPTVWRVYRGRIREKMEKLSWKLV